MNESTAKPNVTTAATCCREFEEYVQKNPATVLFVAVGLGLVAGVLVRALRPEPRWQDRAVDLFNDLERRVGQIAAPMLRKAGEAADEGAKTLQAGWEENATRLRKLMAEGRRRLGRLLR